MKNAQHHPSQVNANQKHNEEAKLPEWPLSKGKKKNQTSIGGIWRNWTPSILVMGIKMGQLLQETSQGFLKQFKIKLAYDLAIPLPGIYPKEMNSKS